MCMTNLSVTNQPPSWPSPTDQGIQTLQASRTGVALLSSSQHLDLSIVTAEGDKVTLSLESKSAALSASQEQLQDDGQDRTSYEKSNVTMALYQREMSFTVEGDLNKDEFKDIQKVMKSLDKMMHQMVTGDASSMASEAGKLQGLDSIAGLQAVMSYESHVLVAQQSQVTAIYNQNGLPENTQPTEQPQADTNLDMKTDTNTDAAADATAYRMAGQIRSSRVPAGRLMGFVHQLIQDYRQQASFQHPRQSRMIGRVQKHLDNTVKDGRHHHREWSDFRSNGSYKSWRKSA